MAYMRKIEPEGRKYGIAKIIPPDGWQMPFAIDTSVRLSCIYCRVLANTINRNSISV